MKKKSWDGRISRDAAIAILENNINEYRTSSVMSLEYGNDGGPNTDLWSEVYADDLDTIKNDKKYKTFEIYINQETKPI
jgi:hypothetical protein